MRILFLLSVLSLALGASPKNGPPGPYHVEVVSGDGAHNSLENRLAQQPLIRVTDNVGSPISGATVKFDTPKAGPGALFSGKSTNFATTTDSRGLATTDNLQQNGVPGTFSILVHVAYAGESVAELALHQSNVHAPLAASARAAQDTKSQQTLEDASTTTVLGVALGDQFMINGVNTPGNANLLPGSRVQTQNTPVTIHIHNQCEFLVGPHSSVSVQARSISVLTGAVRAKQFGDCKMGYGGLWVTSTVPNGDGVVALSSNTMEVGSVTGPIQIANALKVVGTVQPGTVSSFAFADSPSASGASLGAPMAPKVAFMLGAGTGAALLGLGLAVTAITQPAPASTSP